MDLVTTKKMLKKLKISDNTNLSWKMVAASNVWKLSQNLVKVASVKSQNETEELSCHPMAANIATAKVATLSILWTKKDKRWRNNLSRMEAIRTPKRDRDFLTQKMMIMMLMMLELWGLDQGHRIKRMMNGTAPNATSTTLSLSSPTA